MMNHIPRLLLVVAILNSCQAAFVNQYEVLGVPEDAEARDIKKAFRALARAWHPDKHQGAAEKAEAADKMKKINAAWEALGTESARAAYDKLKDKMAAFESFAKWASGDEYEEVFAELPAFFIFYFACPAYTEYELGFLLASVVCSSWLTLHIPVLMGFWLLHKFLRWGPVPDKPGMQLVFKVLDFAALGTVLTFGTFILILCMLYGESLSMAFLMLVAVWLVYYLAGKSLPPKKVQKMKQWWKKTKNESAKLWKRLDTNPAMIVVQGETVFVRPSEKHLFVVEKQSVSKEDPKTNAQRKNMQKGQQQNDNKKMDEIYSKKVIAETNGSPVDKSTNGKSSGAPKKTTPDWNTADQKALEKALRSVPPGVNGRWDKIADLVPGKNKKQCVDRFQELSKIS